MPTAIVSRNAVVTHCAAAAVTPRLCISGGVALLIIVSLRMTTNDETKIRLMTSLLRRAVSAAAASSIVVAFMTRLKPQVRRDVLGGGGCALCASRLAAASLTGHRVRTSLGEKRRA